MCHEKDSPTTFNLHGCMFRDVRNIVFSLCLLKSHSLIKKKLYKTQFVQPPLLKVVTEYCTVLGMYTLWGVYTQGHH